jgi:hypothetical protein
MRNEKKAAKKLENERRIRMRPIRPSLGSLSNKRSQLGREGNWPPLLCGTTFGLEPEMFALDVTTRAAS